MRFAPSTLAVSTSTSATGDDWDLFFPGYYTAHDERFEHNVGSHPIGRGFGSQWFFHSRDFDMLRSHVEQASGERWTYSGGTDLVLVNGWLPERGEPVIDWVSTQSGSLSEHADSTRR